jgi:protein-L-isoaspartate(D-aspartate) O-methyltransferase
MLSPIDNSDEATRDGLLAQLEENGVLDDEHVRAAFVRVDRCDFVSADYLSECYEDYPLPIGYEQTISQPTTVAFMLEKLGAQPGERVLDVGSGSGYTTALLSEIVGDGGFVYGTELVAELVEFGRSNLAKYAPANAAIEEASEEIGLPGEAPFERILVSAEAQELPGALLEQLAVGGTMVIPIVESIWKIYKTESGTLETEEFPGFVFVPLVP